MVRRAGVGATAASAVVFSLLLLSSVAVYASSQDRARLYAQADAADTAADRFAVMRLAGGADVLYLVQRSLSSSPLSCGSANSTAAEATASASWSQRAGNLTVAVRGSLAGSGAGQDNLTALAPLDGGVDGDLNIDLLVSGSGTAPPGISFSRTEVHLVHLGVRLSAAVSDCESAYGEITAALKGSEPDNCTDSAVGATVENALGRAESMASGDGFSLRMAYDVADASGCSVAYDLILQQGGIQGVGGVFGVTLEETGLVSLTPRS